MNSSLDVGAVIRRTFRIYVDQAPVLMPIAAVVFAITGVLGSLLSASGLTLIALIVSVLATTLFTGMIVRLVADLRDGRREASAGQLLRAVRPVFGQLVWVVISAALSIGLLLTIGLAFVASLLLGTSLGGGSAAGAVFAGVIGLLLFVVPALFLATVWSLAAPVVVLERPGGLRALGRSRQLVRGNRWRVFAVILLLVLVLGAAGAGIVLAAETAGAALGLAARVIVGVLATPISALAQAVLYFDLRASRGSGTLERPDESGPFHAGGFPPAAS
jgi:hypothetical protein